MLTTTLYLDFGDRFAGGTLSDTEANFTAANVNGPDFDGVAGTDTLTFTSFANAITSLAIDYDNSGTFTASDITSLRANVVALVQRYYHPFDVTVVELTSAFQLVNGHMVRAAASLADVTTTLTANNADTEHFDCYEFVTGLSASPGAISSTLNGQAGGPDIGLTNASDDSAVALVNNILSSGTTTTADTQLAYTVAHEAGHTFSLQHDWNGIDDSIQAANAGAAGSGSFEVTGDVTGSLIIGQTVTVTDSPANDGTYTIRAGSSYNAATRRTMINVAEAVPSGVSDNDDELSFDYVTDALRLNRSELIVGSAGSTNRLNFDFFSRFSLVTDSSLDDENAQPVLLQNSYDELANDPNIGLKAGAPAYITGTGAFDVITVTRLDATTANVQVQPYRSVSSGVFSGAIGSPFNYPVNYTNGLLIEAGFSDDRIVLDGDLGVNITVRGMAGDDELVVMGKGAPSATYSPAGASQAGLDDNESFKGTVSIGTTIIQFEEFEPAGSVLVQNVGSLALVTPNGNDDLTVEASGANRNQISGTSGGVGIVPLLFTSITSVTVDTATNDGGFPNDTIGLSGNFVATGLKNFTINSGAGADRVINYSSSLQLPVAGGALTFNGGAGSDTLEDRTDTQNTWTLTAANTGNLDARLSFNSVENLTGRAGIDEFKFLAGSSLGGNIVAGNGGDVLDLSALLAAQSVVLTSLGGFADFNGTAATTIGGTFSNINKILGSASAKDDSLTGIDADANWRLDATNTYTSTNTLEFANFEVLNGGSAADVFDVITLVVRTTLNGNAGDDRFNIATGDLDTVTAKITITGGADDDRVLLDDDGTADPVHYAIDPNSVTSTNDDCSDRDFKGIAFDGTVEQLTLDGTQGANEFVVAPSSTTEFIVHGNDPAAGDPDNRDYLEIVFLDTVNRKLTFADRANGDGQWTFGNRQPVAFTGIEKFNYFPIVVSGTDAGGGPHVRVFDADSLSLSTEFFAYSPLFTGGVRVATGDINNDGIPDIVTAAGPTGGPHIRAFDAASGVQLANYGRLGSFFAYELAGYAPVGIQLATGDFDGDGWSDLVVGGYTSVDGNESGSPVARPAPHVRVFSGRDGHEMANFATKGINVAVGDINGDGTPEIVIGIDGPGRLPIVQVFNGFTGQTFPAADGGSFFAYDPLFRGGVYVATGDVNGDGLADIITGAGPGGGPHVRVFSGLDRSILKDFFAYAPSFIGGVRVAAADLDGDGLADIVTGAGPSGGPHLRVFSGLDLSDLGQRFAYSPLFTGGIFVAAHPETSSATQCPPALAAAEGAVGAGGGIAALNGAQLDQIRLAAVNLWDAAGLSVADAARLSQIEFRLSNLPADQLLRARGDLFLVDRFAAGHGWFVDPTPLVNEEFTAGLEALPGSDADDHYDLATAIVRALGEAMGLDHVAGAIGIASLMGDELPLGIRHVPAPADVAAVFAEGEF